ncbi:MAG: hypothetical protein A3F84_29455 [Candidatus Handelsmanbacteria bacterium RIFCSPLOWO2_12_FULL_64_10]|uniref:AAA+ ATPase domain-containing protein n=1 Tax=Handelsmanbacteria sp. (strain RIFCSPLOWO2_12_FULL_64_10) TaxID=1817868 RepID=A0A1F6CBT7_HANXR|nr:MAG: hypothetical protein A3F84_29455 [Candidatus Handelsmanbacteria bacterium RIFCSPLOWO2_12_FULL_64_10]
MQHDLLQAARTFRRQVAVGWDDVAGLDDAKHSLASALALMLAQPPPGARNDPVLRILLYGAPGTGKTLLAAAVSTLFRLDPSKPASFYAVKIPELRDPQTVTALFDVLRQDVPAVSFYDEVEAIALRRGSDMDQDSAQRKLLSTFLSELDGFGNKGVERPWILHIAATNRPWDLDEAILSRFTLHVYVPLPDDALRRRIVEMHLARNGYALTDGLDWKTLLDKTDRFSGRELETLTQQVVARMIRQENPGLEELAVRDPARLRQTRLVARPLVLDDFLRILEQMNPLTSPAYERRYLKWARSPFAAAG